MKTLIKAIIASVAMFGALGFAAANAKPSNHAKPAHCDIDHDHRSHNADYYNFYPHDSYYRAGPYRSSGLSFSITLGNDRYDRRDQYDGRRHGYRGDAARQVHREVFDTRYRARIVLSEEVVRTRRGHQLVCNVSVQGPEARYVPDRRVRRIAKDNCSNRARINVYT